MYSRAWTEKAPSRSRNLSRILHYDVTSDQKVSCGGRENETGGVVFGPMSVDVEKYLATFKVKVDGNRKDIIGTVDVNPSTNGPPIKPAAEEVLSPGSREQTITLDFDALAGPKYEFRVFANGNGSIAVREIVLDRR